MNSFKCPECKGKKECGSLIIEPSMEFFEPGKKPHQYETHFITCSECHYYIPDRLAYSTSNEEYKNNVNEWKENFKPYAENVESFRDQLT